MFFGLFFEAEEKRVSVHAVVVLHGYFLDNVVFYCRNAHIVVFGIVLSGVFGRVVVGGEKKCGQVDG